jgi:hypothetical protein
MKNKGLIPLFDKFEAYLGDKTWFCGKNVRVSSAGAAGIVLQLT